MPIRQPQGHQSQQRTHNPIAEVEEAADSACVNIDNRGSADTVGNMIVDKLRQKIHHSDVPVDKFYFGMARTLDRSHSLDSDTHHAKQP